MAIIETNGIRPREIRPGWNGRFVHSTQMTFAYYAVTRGASIHEHAHLEEEVWNVVDGEIEITIGGETGIIGPGGVGVVPPNTAHSVRVLRHSRVSVVDHPVRHIVGGIDTR